jgi:hypothetical protein
VQCPTYAASLRGGDDALTSPTARTLAVAHKDASFTLGRHFGYSPTTAPGGARPKSFFFQRKELERRQCDDSGCWDLSNNTQEPHST